MDHMLPSDFLCLFNSRVKPDSVLRPNVSLCALTDKEAIFVETAEKIITFPISKYIRSSLLHSISTLKHFQNVSHGLCEFSREN